MSGQVDDALNDALETAFWEFDSRRKKDGQERLAFKEKARWLVHHYGTRRPLIEPDFVVWTMVSFVAGFFTAVFGGIH